MLRKIVLIFMTIVFLSLFLFAGYQILSIYQEYQTGEETYEDIQQFVSQDEPTTSKECTYPIFDETIIDSMEVPCLSWPEVDFDSLLAVNPDVVGWIYIEGTAVNYPIVKGNDNDYYLKRLVDGKYNSAGSIFMDYRNLGDFSDTHSILYGHNMKNGSMFAVLGKYKDQNFFEEHPYCQIMTPEGNYLVEFFSGYDASTEDDSWQRDFLSDEEFRDWLDSAVNRSVFSSDVSLSTEDRIVTLSTCSYVFDDARFVLIGKITEVLTQPEG